MATGIDATYDRALVSLEANVAMGLDRRSPDLAPLVDQMRPHRGALLLDAAHTVLPEASVYSLPAIARDELKAGLDGPVRRKLAEYEPPSAGSAAQAIAQRTNRYLEDLRDQILRAIGGGPGLEGALRVIVRIHLARAVRLAVPLAVSMECLAWYLSYVPAESPEVETFTRATSLAEGWASAVEDRPQLEIDMMALALSAVGSEPSEVLNISV